MFTAAFRKRSGLFDPVRLPILPPNPKNRYGSVLTGPPCGPDSMAIWLRGSSRPYPRKQEIHPWQPITPANSKRV